MFKRFTSAARAVVCNAVAEHERRSDPMIGTEHLLVGIAAVDGELGGDLLARFGVTPQRLREAMDVRDAEVLAAIGIDVDAELLNAASVPLPDLRRGHHPFTAGAKKTLEDALREALALQHRHIGVEHIALALTARTGDDPALRLLERLDVQLPDVREELLRGLRATA